MKDRLRYTITILISWVGFFSLSGQNNSFLTFQHLNREKGISASFVFATLEDRAGFHWFATANGLNRYDGQQIRVFLPENGNPQSLSHPTTKCLLEDRKGMIWVGTQGGGLCKFNPENEQFTTYKHVEGDPSSLSHDEVLCLAEDPSGRLWIGTENGLNLFDPVANRFYNAFSHPGTSGSLASPAVLSLALDRMGRLWVGSWSGGLQVFFPEKIKLDLASREIFPAFVSIPVADGRARHIDNSNIWCMETDHWGRLWVGTLGGGIWLSDHEITAEELLHPESIVFYNAQFSADGQGISDNKIYSLFEDKQHRMWAGSYQGINLSLPMDHALNGPPLEKWLKLNWIKIQRSGLIQAAPISNGVRHISGDRDGTVWVSTQSGVSSHSPSSAWVKSYHVSSIPEQRIRINAFMPVSDSLAWVGTNRGLETLDLRDYQLRLLTSAHDQVIAVARETGGKIWFCTRGKIYFISQAGSTPREISLPLQAGALELNTLYARYNGEVWVLTNNGLYILDGNTARLKQHYTADKQKKGSLTDNKVYALQFSGPRAAWLVTENGGLLKAIEDNTGKWTFKNWVPFPENPRSLLNMNMKHLAVVDSGVWIASVSGLWFFNEKKASFKLYGEMDGLPTGGTNSVVVDTKGRVWCQITEGIAFLDPQSHRFRCLYEKNGLYNIDFQPGSLVALASGLVLNGGDNGLAVLNGDEVSSDESLPEVRLMSLRIFNKLIEVGEEDKWSHAVVLSQALAFSRLLELNHHHTMVGFDFSVLNTPFPAQSVAAYRFSGMNEEWTEIGNQRAISFTNIQPGTHLLEVKAANSQGKWGPVTRLTVQIRPPIWGTLWFQVVAVLLTALAIGFFLTNRLRSIAAQNQKLESQVLARTQELEAATQRERDARSLAEEAARAKADFLSVMSHEIRTPLHAVISMSNHIMDENPRADQLDHLRILKLSSDHLLNLINNILDFSKIEAGKLEISSVPFNLFDLSNGLVQLLSIKAESKPVEFKFFYDPALSHWFLGDQVRLGQVLTNLLGNAEKFTSQGAVSLSLKHVSPDGILIEVQDTGIGIPLHKQRAVFEPFVQSDSETALKFGGTGLGLNISRRLLALMGADLHLRSEAGKGATFSFVIKLSPTQQPPVSSEKDLESFGEFPLKNIRVLVVEDNVVNQKIVNRYLKKWGAEVFIANNGQECLTYFETRSADLVLMDLQMPIMDGITATQSLREKGFSVPVIGLSAAVLEDEVRKMKASGMNDFVPKPYQPLELIVSMVRLLQIRQEL